MPDLPELPRLTMETWIAVGAIAVGLFLCFRGFAAMRWILAMIGGFAGWQVGSWAATFIHVDPDFDTALRWGAMVFSVVLFGSLAYAFFVTGVLVAVGWLGYTAGALALVESVSLTGLDLSTAPGLLNYGMIWNIGFLVLAAAGVFLQLRTGKQSNLQAIYS